MWISSSSIYWRYFTKAERLNQIHQSWCTAGISECSARFLFLYSTNWVLYPKVLLPSTALYMVIFLPRPPWLLSHFIIEGEPPPPRSTPWAAYRSIISPTRWNLHFCLAYLMQLSLPHSLMADRRTVVGHVLTDHMCSFMCNNHIDMTAHNLAFLWVG